MQCVLTQPDYWGGCKHTADTQQGRTRSVEEYLQTIPLHAITQRRTRKLTVTRISVHLGVLNGTWTLEWRKAHEAA